MRRQMKDPVRRRLVLPHARLEQIAHDRYRSCTTYAVRRLRGSRETEDPMAAGFEHLDQLHSDESGGFRDECRRPCVACHVASVECERTGDH
jgi:hypothetical protein